MGALGDVSSPRVSRPHGAALSFSDGAYIHDAIDALHNYQANPAQGITNPLSTNAALHQRHQLKLRGPWGFTPSCEWHTSHLLSAVKQCLIILPLSPSWLAFARPVPLQDQMNSHPISNRGRHLAYLVLAPAPPSLVVPGRQNRGGRVFQNWLPRELEFMQYNRT
jgi:hypothetical protein